MEQIYWYVEINLPSRDRRLLGLQFSKKKEEKSLAKPNGRLSLKQPELS